MANKTDWENYIADYENNMPAPTPDNIADYAKQLAYLQWLKAIYDQYENDWDNMPDTISMTAKTASGTYQSRLDHQWHAVIITPFSGSSTVMAQSDEFNVTVTMELYDSRGRMPEFTSEYYDDGYYIGVRSFVTLDGSYVKQSLNGEPYFTDSTYDNGSTGWRFYTCQIRIPKTGSPGEQSQNTFGSAYNFIAVGSQATIGTGGLLTTLTGDIDTDSPWDYYNDEILPNIDPDNAAFPKGYEPPFNPDDPSDDPTTDPDTLPHDDGDTPLPFQEGNQIDAPSMFITQYICTKSDLTLLGANLWSSWVDPNAGANTAKNFIFDYFQDTGTFNITTALDYIISLRVFPFAFSKAHISMGVSDGIYIGTGHTNFTNQSLNVLNEVNGWIDAGKKKVIPEEPYNDFRDMYNCTIQLYMPFCGSLELNPVEVINREVSVRYYIDFQSACCTAVAFVQGDKGKYPIGSKSGQIGFTLPITATNSGQLAAQFASDATRALGTVGNFGMQMAKAALAASTAQAGGELAAAKSPEYASQISQSTSLQLKGINQGVVGSTGNLGLDLANQAIDMLSRSGVGMPLLSGGGGCESLMFQAGCTIQIRRGKYVNLNDIQYGHMQGNALAETKHISEFSGFCKFAGVDTTGLTCHNDERNEILSLLESGVYV